MAGKEFGVGRYIRQMIILECHLGAGKSPRSEEGDFSDDGDAVIARLCEMIDKMPATSEDQLPAGADEDEALSSVSEETAVAAALPADLGSRVQSRVREIEDEVPVEARKFLMARAFEMVAFCSDLRAEAATERGAALALQSQLVEARREVAALQRRAIVAEAGPEGAGCGLGAPAAGAVGAPSRPMHDHVAFLTPTCQTDAPARDVIVRVGEKRCPHVKFSGVDPDIAPHDFLERLNNRNPGLGLDLETCKVRVTYRERAGTCAYIAEVNPEAFKELMSRPRLSLGWTMVRVTEDLHVPTCTFCATYGHGRTTCPVRNDASKAVCMRCAGEHLGSTCRVRMGEAAVCCAECRRAGLPSSSHPAGHPECPRLMERVARLRARTNYGA
ncbi:hypothetical protein HPB49_014023 [Dermacentor silvarum]|uniref:Uncharacterized protein n=1 Tax=Dermacentor silvarum TaxID=543639 RepID=A0ACB8C3Z7_DERSI|nr:hypothetical protein HPB49_014023 [Dermacentor silvarum]